MDPRNTHDYLVQLRDLILVERECAKNLDMEGMQAAMLAKDELVGVLGPIQDLHDKEKPLAEEIRNENRRNAFLFKATLGWIRKNMEFFGQKTVTSTYSSQAGTVAAQVNGRLLSGKV